MAAAGMDVIIGGDFNLVMDTLLDRSAQRFGQTGSLSSDGDKWLVDMGLMDVWRHQYPSARNYTYFSSSHLTYARLDYFLLSPPTFVGYG